MRSAAGEIFGPDLPGGLSPSPTNGSQGETGTGEAPNPPYRGFFLGGFGGRRYFDVTHAWLELYSTAPAGSVRGLVEGIIWNVLFAWIAAVTFGATYNGFAQP